MFNLGAGEVLIIALLALIVLGPARLPDAARQIGSFMGEIRKMSSGFQREMKAAFDDEAEKAARARGAAAVANPDAVDEPAASTPTIGALTPTDAPMPAELTAPEVPPVSPRRARGAPLHAPAKQPAAKQAAAKQAAPAKKAAAKKAAAAKSTAKKQAATKQVPAKKAPARKARP